MKPFPYFLVLVSGMICGFALANYWSIRQSGCPVFNLGIVLKSERMTSDFWHKSSDHWRDAYLSLLKLFLEKYK